MVTDQQLDSLDDAAGADIESNPIDWEPELEQDDD